MDRPDEIRQRLAELDEEIPEVTARLENLVEEHQALTEELTGPTVTGRRKFKVVRAND